MSTDGNGSGSDRSHRALWTALEAELPAAVELRRRIHADPHVAGDEGPTRDLVLSHLPAGTTTHKAAETGAVLRVGGPGDTVALRAELDGLEVDERTGVAWASRTPGVMHACGHDVHLAALVAVARVIDRVGGPAPVLAILQPREETAPSGAQDIVASGVLEAESCRAVVAAHVQPQLTSGVTACTVGVVNAASDEFTIKISGKGGHAAYPHTSTDPVVTAAHVVVALQAVRHRTVDPVRTVVLTTTRIEAGTTTNVVPDHATIQGTVRTISAVDRDAMLAQLTQVATAVSAAYGCRASIHVDRGEPPLVNDGRLALRAATELASNGIVVDDSLRSAGSDDFSFYCEQLPSLMMFVGVGDGDDRLHSAHFLPEDAAVGDVARTLLAGYLAAASEYSGSASRCFDYHPVLEEQDIDA